MYNYPNNNYPTYNNAYYTSSLKDMRDQIDRQLQQQQQMQQQMQQQPQINQTFQLSTPQGVSDFDCRYMDNIDEVKKALVFRNSIFVNKDMTTMWFKDSTGNIRTFTMNEVIEKDEKDMQIENLTEQLNELKAILLSSSNRQNEPFYYPNQQVIPEEDKNRFKGQINANDNVNNGNVVKRNKGDVRNEQRNNKYNDEQPKESKS